MRFYFLYNKTIIWIIEWTVFYVNMKNTHFFLKIYISMLETKETATLTKPLFPSFLTPLKFWDLLRRNCFQSDIQFCRRIWFVYRKMMQSANPSADYYLFFILLWSREWYTWNCRTYIAYHTCRNRVLKKSLYLYELQPHCFIINE